MGKKQVGEVWKRGKKQVGEVWGNPVLRSTRVYMYSVWGSGGAVPTPGMPVVRKRCSSKATWPPAPYACFLRWSRAPFLS